MNMPIIINSNPSEDSIFKNSVSIQIANIIDPNQSPMKKPDMNDASIKRARIELEKKKKIFEDNPQLNIVSQQYKTTQNQENPNMQMTF